MNDSSLRFRPANRLNTPQAFAAVFEKGQKFHLKAGLYLVLQNESLVARLGLILAKKKIRYAVQRNYLKRVQRECFRAHRQILAGYDVVFVVNHKIGQLCQSDWFALCQADWRQLAKRCGRV